MLNRTEDCVKLSVLLSAPERHQTMKNTSFWWETILFEMNLPTNLETTWLCFAKTLHACLGMGSYILRKQTQLESFHLSYWTGCWQIKIHTKAITVYRMWVLHAWSKSIGSTLFLWTVSLRLSPILRQNLRLPGTVHKNRRTDSVVVREIANISRFRTRVGTS